MENIIEEIIGSKWFLDWKDSLKLEYSTLNIEALKDLCQSITNSIDIWEMATGNYYEILPLERIINNLKKGKLIKKLNPDKKTRVINYGFVKNNTPPIIEYWEINGDKIKFGCYYKVVVNDSSSKKIYFMDKNDIRGTISLQSITEEKWINANERIFLSVNGQKPNNWYLRHDEVKTGKETKITLYDPIFKLERTIELLYEKNELINTHSSSRQLLSP